MEAQENVKEKKKWGGKESRRERRSERGPFGNRTICVVDVLTPHRPKGAEKERGGQNKKRKTL